MMIMLDSFAVKPTKSHEDDAGFDLYAPTAGVIDSHNSLVIDTGVHVKIPRDWCGLVCNRSGLNVRHGITCSGVGVIDAGYTGSICVKLYNNTDKPYIIAKHDRVAQLLIMPVYIGDMEVTDDLGDSVRGDCGFGSSGR